MVGGCFLFIFSPSSQKTFYHFLGLNVNVAAMDFIQRPFMSLWLCAIFYFTCVCTDCFIEQHGKSLDIKIYSTNSIHFGKLTLKMEIVEEN